VNGAISSETPAQPAAALTRSERPVLPYSFMLCGPIEGGVRRRRRRRGGRDPRGARAREETARRASGGTGEPREEATRARDAQKTRTRSHAFLDACLSAREAGRPGVAPRYRRVGWWRVRTMVSCGHRGERNSALSRRCVRSLSRRASLWRRGA
jgi:hypothetical protein